MPEIQHIYPEGNNTFTHNNKGERLYYKDLVTMKHDETVRQDSLDAVLHWCDDEQGFLMEVASLYAREVLEKAEAGLWMVDPGCGSGILSLGIAKEFESLVRSKVSKIVAIDVNQKALEYAKFNAVNNGLSDLCKFRLGKYESQTLPSQSSILIAHNVPYHPHQTKFDGKILTSCSGGEDGQRWLKPFLEASGKHLANGGMVYGTTKCRGKELPEFMSYIREYFPTASVYWHELYEPFSNFEFLDYINRGEAKQWCEQMATEQLMLHHGVYIIVKDNKSQFELIKNYRQYIYDNSGIQWHKDAHRQIQDNAKK
jgi:SAM-dependent methyltransferase